MPPDSGQAAVGDLVRQLSEQTSSLVRLEMRLAQLELKEKGKKAGMGIGMFGAAGVVAFFGAAVLVFAIVLALDTELKAWASALIVSLALLVLAGVAALLGKKQIGRAIPPAPEQAIASVKKDVETVKRSAGQDE